MRFKEGTKELIELAKQFVFVEGNSWTVFTHKYFDRSIPFSLIYRGCPELLELKKQYYKNQGRTLYVGTKDIPPRVTYDKKNYIIKKTTKPCGACGAYRIYRGSGRNRKVRCLCKPHVEGQVRSGKDNQV